ncbi:Tim17-domain-containing protein [Violaceomyces palustris]|uniref:Tim17-domain-containing protein n=1 Tax=Violaceomyces palustris TaxID=1673888 RepID=A0ACD0P2J4_9BASI|nr:Tim17-domain-containing protein [Violaceomyces palustris]
MPLVAPVYLPGQEPLPMGATEEDRAQLNQIAYWNKMASMGMESCAFKTVLSGALGFALGGFFSLMSTSFAVDDPLRRTTLAGVNGAASELSTAQQTKQFFKETGKGMYKSGKGFGKVGALYSGIECCIESYRAKNDIYNPVYAGALAGGILARNAGPQAVVGGAFAFAAFSGAIDLYFRRETSDED